ncbi:hypothetical protein NIIDNTM18_42570 [Mycolicibacterium litorale]|uniref:GIY-YIG domain-containing protein n=1 Tax=Mycolicibacterium litorale TaxID=758802 RepID=A0A6S6P989_9MYCO|nr:GIY-YIG nuclease family protein [Mycolicibacterium litorale]BCI54979.1 hypothetical protein NIIDNTM18_42570 [Mycolicibacterium litorale]
MAKPRLYWDAEVGDFPEWIYDPNDRTRWHQLTIPDGWYVYTMFGVSRPALYIGMTGHLYRRLAQHARSKPWWTEVDHIIVGLAESREAAHEWERRYIRRANPVYNLERYGAI